jgi:cytochrome c5
MSDAHTHEHDAPHEGPIKTPKQLILAVLFAFVVPIAVIVLLVLYVSADNQPAAGTDAMNAEAVALRLSRVGTVEVKDVSDPSALKSGEQVYTAQCAACHAAGVAGAPKFGDEALWGPRVKTGYDALLTSALKGKGAMAAQGGGDFTDLEIGRAVVYMANKGGAKFEEPKAAAPATSADSAPAAVPVATAVAAMPAVMPPAADAKAADAAVAPPLYAQVCQACHVAGVAGAPKFGDKAAWASRVGQGVDALTAVVIMGKGAMPPKGGAATASEADIKAVVAYMVSAVK